MNVALVVAGSLSLVAAAVHGIAGEVLVVRRLSPATLPASPFGGPGTTKLMIRASWHMTTIGFVSVGCGLVLAGTVLHGGAARGIAVVAAAAATGFAGVALVGALAGSPRALVRHPAPIGLTVAAVLAWCGIVFG
jgi:hypothetical protein